MKIDEIIATQRIERSRSIDAILSSDAPKKIIVSGPGTGKTSIFRELLQRTNQNNNLVLTFIRRLVSSLDDSLGSMAEVKTFHAYCKKILHELSGRVELIPYLTQIIVKDAELLDMDLSDFNKKFRELQENAPEIDFYLKRGDYYGAVSFDDAVFRLYMILRENQEIVPEYEQIIIDEYQDFNKLEVVFIEVLESRGPIIIVGDDDQAVYDDRSASSEHIRLKYNSGEYAPFPLPYCCRCTHSIVKASSEFIKKAQSLGYLRGRIAKDFTCFLEAKVLDSRNYPKIITARCTTAQIMARYVAKEIELIPAEDIADSWRDGDEYPTVLIIGKKQFLNVVYKELGKNFTQVQYEPSRPFQYGLDNAYEQLLIDSDSNLGWRILAENFLDLEDQKRLLRESETGKAMVDLLDGAFIEEHRGIIEVIEQIRDDVELNDDQRREFVRVLGTEADSLMSFFSNSMEEQPIEYDRAQPLILLTSFKGCKGLSGGHVFIVGANNGNIPNDVDNIDDLEISQFFVALTRTRKQCHFVSTKWLIKPKDSKGSWIPEAEVSTFVSWIPSDIIEDRGILAASDLPK